MNKTPIPSEETKQEAMKIAKATQKPGQTKDQTRLIAQGIEKGIALYKKQQKEKQRQADKDRKKRMQARQKHVVSNTPSIQENTSSHSPKSNRLKSILPWGLTLISWGLSIFLWLQIPSS
ncbi:DUF2956 domain-containing protein [Vibrio sp. PP-XX7]